MTKERVKFNGQVPYGGAYRIQDPITGVWLHRANFTMLLQQLYEVRHANSMPAGAGLEEELHQWVCQVYPAECENLDPDRPRVRRLGLDDVLRGTKVLVEVIAKRFLNLVGLSENPLVEQEEADRRAAICLNCPMLTGFSKPCSGICPELQTVVNLIKGSRTTALDQTAKICSICGCIASANVFVQTDISAKGMTEEMKQQFNRVADCWKASKNIP